jgi:hypothetical protein
LEHLLRYLTVHTPQQLEMGESYQVATNPKLAVCFSIMSSFLEIKP